jgi:hypothetical protein
MKHFHAFLGDHVEAQTGFTSRRDPNAGGPQGVRILSAADLVDGSFDFGPPRRAGEKVSPDRYGVEPGEIFFKTRGAAFEAATLPMIDEPMVFAAPLVRLKFQTSDLDGGYLVWLLNSAPVQQQLQVAARGTAVRSIGPIELRQLKIPIPPLDLQRRIAEADALRRREAHLMSRLIHLRKDGFDQAVHNHLSPSPNNRLQQEQQ